MTVEGLAALGLRVKPLGRWYALDVDAGRAWCSGDYDITHRERVCYRLETPAFVLVVGTLGAAKAAAEADHATRIAAQIEETP